MLYLAIPAHNEVATIGVLLWRLRTVLAEFPREYEVVVYDDASTDETAEVARQYEHAMPVTVLRGTRHLGYAGAVDALLRYVAGHTRYPRRDAVLLLQGDFTDPPEIVPEFARRFEGGADLVVGERQVVADAPVAVRRLFRGAHWALRPFVRVDGVRDLTASMRLVRISALRDALRDAGDTAVVNGDSWTANADLLLRLAPHARRVESVPVEPTYGVRMRETRRVALRDALAALKWGWGARGRRVAARVETDAADGDRRPGRNARRKDEPELSVEKLREKVREARGGREAVEEKDPRGRRGRGDRTERPARERSERQERSERPERPAREERTPRPARGERSERPERTDKAERAPRARVESPESRLADLDPAAGTAAANTVRAAKPERRDRQHAENGSADNAQSERAPRERPQRPERTPRGERTRRRDERETTSTSAAHDATLDDPFAPRAPRVDPFAAALDRESSPRRDDESAQASAEASAQESTDTVIERPRAALPSTDGDEGSVDADTTDDAADDGSEDGEATDGANGEVRKRRRRSRRGRRRRGGERGEAGTDGAADNAAEASSDASDEAPRDITVEGAAVARRAPADGDEDGADAEDSDTDDAADGDQPRARRRGRRGRRGGSRRSRHRREPDGQSGDAASPGMHEGGTHESAPPPAWESDAPSDD